MGLLGKPTILGKPPERRLANLGRQRFSKSLPKCSGAAWGDLWAFRCDSFFVATKKHMKPMRIESHTSKFCNGRLRVDWMNVLSDDLCMSICICCFGSVNLHA